MRLAMWSRPFGAEAANGETQWLTLNGRSCRLRLAFVLTCRRRYGCGRLARCAAEQFADARPAGLFLRHQFRELGSRCRVCQRRGGSCDLVEKRHQITEVFIELACHRAPPYL